MSKAGREKPLPSSALDRRMGDLPKSSFLTSHLGISIEKARKYGYSIKNNSVLVEKRPIDMKNRGFLPKNKKQ